MMRDSRPVDTPDFGWLARPATESDLPTIVELWREFMAEMIAENFYEDAAGRMAVETVEPLWRERTEFCIALGHVAVLVVTLSGEQEEILPEQVAGFSAGLGAELNPLVPHDALMLTETFTQPRFRLVAATHDLFCCVRELARQAGKTRLITNTHENNRRVKLILRRLGFARCQPLAFNVTGHGFWQADISR